MGDNYGMSMATNSGTVLGIAPREARPTSFDMRSSTSTCNWYTFYTDGPVN